MGKFSARHILASVGIPVVAVAINVFALGSAASAHVVTSITADCSLVTVHFSDFPETGVSVHISADVNGTTAGTDSVVTNTTTEARLDISPETVSLFGATADIDVNVTWTYLGPQRAYEHLSLVCGNSTSTVSSTTTATTTTSTTAPVTTTTEVPVTLAIAPQSTTTTNTHVLGTTVLPTTSAPEQTTEAAVGPQGRTVPPTTAPTAGTTLPRTGAAPVFPLLFGLSSIVAGSLLMLRRHRVWSPDRP